MLVTLAAVPIVVGAGVWAWSPRKGWALGLPVIGALGASLVVAVLAATRQPSTTIRWGAGLSLRLEVGDLARLPLVLVAFVGLAAVIYALGYGAEAGRARMVGLLVAFVGAMELVLIAGDFLTLLIAWELVGAISWGLIAHHWRGGAPAQATQAFVATRVGDLGLFAAAGATFAATGSLDFAALASVGDGLAAVAVAGVVLAAVAKSAQVPFSPWLFSAMAGPTPASALLHSATMVAAGAYLLARLQPFLDTVAWFAAVVVSLGLVTALAGGVVAAAQADAKRLLAASTSAQYGLMLVAVGAGYPGVAIAHLVAHGLFKALLFISAGVAIDAAGTGHLAAMRLGRRLPVVAGITVVGAAALAGVPPLGAAWSKEGVVAAGGHITPWIGVGVIAAGGLSALYATRFLVLGFGPGGPQHREALADRGAVDARAAATPTGRGAGDAPARGGEPGRVGGLGAARVAGGLLAVATVLIGVAWTPWGEELLTRVTATELPSRSVWELVASVGVVLLGAGAVVILDRRRGLRTATSGAGAWVGRWFDLARACRVLVVAPTLALGRTAARFDDRVVDAGVRGAAGLGRVFSTGFARADDRVVDAGVRAVVAIAAWMSRALDRAGEVSIDGAVDGLARLTGLAGRDGRRLQSGQAHQYYAGITLILAALVAAVVLWS